MTPTLQCRTEDHVTPLLQTINEMRLAVAFDLPKLPEQMMVAQTQMTGGSLLSIKIMPSWQLVEWFSKVMGMETVCRAQDARVGPRPSSYI